MEDFQTRRYPPCDVLRTGLLENLELTIRHVHLQVPTRAEASYQECFFFVFDQLDEFQNIFVPYRL